MSDYKLDLVNKNLRAFYFPLIENQCFEIIYEKNTANFSHLGCNFFTIGCKNNT
jgi:hypothetical protein